MAIQILFMDERHSMFSIDQLYDKKWLNKVCKTFHCRMIVKKTEDKSTIHLQSC